MTGTGKTTLAEKLLSACTFVIAVDLKRDLKWQGWKVTSDINVAFSLRHSIFRPRNANDLQTVFARAYKEGGWTIYVDEVYLLGPKLLSPRGGESQYVICLTSGRSKGVTIYTSTQRPKYLPLFAATESAHVFVFALGQDDFKTLASLVGNDVLSEIAKSHEGRQQIKLGTHKFLYINREKDTVVISKVNK